MYLLVSRARLVLLIMGTGWRDIWRTKRLQLPSETDMGGLRTHTRRRRRQRRPAVSVEMKVGGGSPIGGGDELVDVAFGCRFSEARERDAINPSRPSFDSNAFGWRAWPVRYGSVAEDG